jgi:predicted XRE-type DNA-binding protein
MSKITIERGTGNVYADLGMADAQDMLVKAKLASKIGEIITAQNLTQPQAADLRRRDAASPPERPGG